MRIVFLMLSCVLALFAGCADTSAPPGALQGTVTIGPIFPVERPGGNPPVPPQVFEARKVMVYDQSGKKLLHELDIHQVDQQAKGSYQVQLAPGVYTVDIKHSGIDRSREVPRTVEIRSGEVVTLDISIDTGIR